MKKMSVYTAAALEIMKQGGFMRSEKQPDGSILIRLYDHKGEKLNGHYNATQICLDGLGVLHGAILSDGRNYINEWTYWPASEPWDYDPRSMANTVYA